MNFEYAAKTKSGEVLSGLLTANSPADVNRQLRDRNLYILSVKPARQGSSLKGKAGRSFRWTKVSKRDLIGLTSQLAIMTRSGVDLATALQDVSAQCPNARLKSALVQIHEDVLSGKKVSRALGAHEHIFGSSYIASIAAAEASGRLADVLNRLAALLRSELRMRNTLRQLLAYPVLLASVSSLVVFALMFFVLPKFADVFQQLEIPLPVITELLVGFAKELRSRWWLWGGVFLAAGVGSAVFRTSEAGRKLIDGAFLHLVFVRDVTRSLVFGRALRLLGTMVESGVPLLDGLRLTRSSIRNSFVRKFFNDLENEVVNGRDLGTMFLSSTIVPPNAGQMIATAERTGTLSSVAQIVGEFFEEEGETRLRELATILEPLIIVVMGLIVAVVVMSVMLPVFDFSTATR